MADELPPLIAQLIGDASDLIATLDDVQARLEAFADQDYEATVGLQGVDAVEATIAKIDAVLEAFADETFEPLIDVDTMIAEAKLASVRASEALVKADLVMGSIDIDEADAIAKTEFLHETVLSIDDLEPVVNINTSIAEARLASLDATIAKVKSDAVMADIAVGAVGADAGKDALAGGLMSKLLWGGGGGGSLVGMIPGLGLAAGATAGVGSLGSLAGFGPEHLLMTALGLGGSAVGAGIGGGLLAGGAAAVGGVGLGTDLAGIGQAAGDIKNTYTSMQALNTAVAAYGQNSSQAVAAQVALNTTLAGFSPIAQGAVAQVASMGDQIHALFNQVTGQAEKTGAQIIGSLGSVAMQYIPVIGQFANENMTIIQNALKPLESWLSNGSGGGLGIFTQLENEFHASLPDAMQAFDSALEVVIKSLGFLSEYTGQLMPVLDKFFTNLNSPAGFSKLESFMASMISDFEAWKGLIEIVAKDIYDLFTNDAGTGKAIVEDLTAMLTKLNEWEKSTTGKAELSSIFAVHKQQILDLLAIIPDLVRALDPILVIMPALVQLTLPFITAIVDLLGDIQRIPGPIGVAVSGFLAFYLVLAKLTTFKDAATIIGSIGTALFGLEKNAATGATVGGGLFANMTSGLQSAKAGVVSLLTSMGILTGTMAISDEEMAGNVAELAALRGISEEAAAAELTDAAATDALSVSFGTLFAELAAVLVPLAAIGIAYEYSKDQGNAMKASVDDLTKSVTVMPTSTLPELNSALDATHSKIATLTDDFYKNGQGLTGIDTSTLKYGLAVKQLAEYQKQLQTEQTDMADNTQLVADHFGITTTQVEQLTSKLGLNKAMQESMTSTTMMKFKSSLDSMSNSSGIATSALSQLAINSGTSMAAVAQASSQAGAAMQQTLSTANNLASGITTGFAAVGTDITNFYNQQNFGMAAFAANVQTAMKLGFSPAVMTQIMTAGPAAGGAALQGLLQGAANQVNGTFVQMTNSAQKQMTYLQAYLQKQAVLMAATAGDPAIAANIGSAMSIWANEAQNGGHNLTESFTSGFQGGMAGAIQTMTSFGMTVPTHLNSGGATATATVAGQQVLDAYTHAINSGKGVAAANAAALAVQFYQGLNGGLPLATIAGVNTASNYNKGTTSGKPGATTAGAGVAQATTMGLGEFLSGFGLSGVKGVQGYIDGADSKKGAAGAKGGEIGQATVDNAGKADGKPAGTAVVTGIIAGVDASKGKLNTDLLEAVKSAIDNARAQAGGQSVGQAMDDGVSQGIQQHGGQIASDLLSTVKSAIDEARSQAGGQSIGVALADGIAQGIGQGSAIVSAAAAGIVNTAKNAANSAANVNSPSRLFRDQVGYPIALGVAMGMSSGAGLAAIKNASSLMINHALGSVTGASGINPVSATSGAGSTTILQVTTPLTVNGATLAQTVTQYQLKGARATGSIAGQYAGGNQSGLSTGVNTNAVSR